MLSTDDIIRAVELRRQQDADYRRELARAVRQKDEYELERLIKLAVLRVLGLATDVTFEVMREVSRRLRA
ncbi:hypothetical protein HNP84_005000 [Thermocatellispora tengchongensis]|uniref:Uncharacterized protein n=1 Tax=Thermocatellispora tengchongensis TaxID=1073253 RepID=A0A840P1W1_9ACTN|nr:hypothetical protein [Thermocatellispora tengchongensis]MBB5135264.1 hypothetical protein [Thermocatellispora tengchongensis]